MSSQERNLFRDDYYKFSRLLRAKFRQGTSDVEKISLSNFFKNHNGSIRTPSCNLSLNFSEVTTTLNRNGFCKSNLTIKLNASPFKIKLCDSALFGHLKHISRRSKNADNLTDEERRVEECERQRIANGRQQGRYSAETDIVYSEVLSILYPSRWGVESELVAKSKERVPPNDIPWLHSNFHPSRNALTKKGDLSNDEVSPNLPLVRQKPEYSESHIS